MRRPFALATTLALSATALAWAVPASAQTTTTLIHDVQGSGAASPLVGSTVTIEGIVTGVDDEIGASFGSGNTIRTFPGDAGIYVQEEPADVDSDPATSEGIFVGFVRSRGNYPPGTRVRLNGVVRDGSSPPAFGQTRIEETTNQEPEILGTAPVPEPVTIDVAAARAQDATTKAYYESLEGMRVRLADATAHSGGTNKFGELFLLPGAAPGDALLRTDPVDASLIGTIDHAGAGDPSNPFRNPNEEANPARVRADQFDTVRNVVGPLNFSFGNFKVAVQPSLLPTVEDTGVEFPFTRVPPAAPGQVRVVSFNVENFFPPGGALDGGTITQAEFDEKRRRLSNAIGVLLRAPDVVAVQEIGDLRSGSNQPTRDSQGTLQALADQLAADGFGTYRAFSQEGNDNRGIDVGFLIKAPLVVNSVTQFGKTATESVAGDCSDVSGGLFDRPPLAADITAPGVVGRIVVFSNHFSSKAAPDSCRDAQATFVRDRVTELEAAGRDVIVTGDLNAFEDETPLAILGGPGSTLTNQFPEAIGERYSFQFNGLLQTLDHQLVTDGLEARVRDIRYAHIDNDYFDRFGSGGGHAAADHDPVVLTLGSATPDPVIPESPVPFLLPLLGAGVMALVLLRPLRRRGLAE